MKNNIAILREQLNITQRELSSMVGISRPYLSDIENNKKNPSCTIADKIIKALDKTFDEVFFTEIVHHSVHNGS